jgi:Lamin Tail Domain
MKKIYLLLLTVITFALSSIAQVSTYTFRATSGSYTPVTTPATVHASNWDDAVLPVIIPFSFLFNNTNYTTASVNSNGYLTFGAATSAGGDYLPISATTSYTGAISAFGRDLISNATTIVSSTEGTAPNRSFVIQWNNARRYSGGAVAGDVLNFQIRLNETTNTIDVVYGTCTATSTTALTSQVGLRGALNTDFNNRSSTTTWSGTTTGTTNADAVTSSNTIMPATGQTYTWTPPPPCVAPIDQPTALTASGFNSAQINGSFTAAASVPNGYVVVRYPSGATPTPPVNGANYAVGATLGAGTVIQFGSALTFTATGLAPLTTYDFYIYSFSNLACSGTAYLAASPLTGSATTLALQPPTCATTFTPLNAATNVTITSGITWSGATAAPAITGYNVYFSSNSALVTSEDVSVRVVNNALVTSYTPAFPGLAFGATYYWKVVPINSVGASTGCIINSFSTYTPLNPTSTAKGGLWSSTATWSTGIVPIAGDNVTISDGSIVTVDQVVTGINNLTIGGGTSGTLLWNNTSNAMTLFGNITINAGAKFLPYTTGGTGQTINLGGNFVNNGYTNLALTSTLLNINGSAQAGGSAAQSISGSGVFQGDGASGIIRTLSHATTGTTTISTAQNLIAVNGINILAGTLNTGGKLSLDNTAQIFGQAFNTQIASIGMTAMGSAYATTPIVFGGAATLWVAGANATAATRYYFGSNVYACSTAGILDATTGPTHTAGIVANGTAQLLWIGTTGTIGNPFSVSATTVGTQYFYGGNLYTCTVAGTPVYTTPPVHTSGTAVSGTATYLYVGTPATANVIHDPTTLTVRALELLTPGSGYTTSGSTAMIVSGGGGTLAAGACTVIQSQLGQTFSLIQRSTVAVVNGALPINSTQGASSQSGVGAITTSGGGVNYTTAPTLGFTGPSGINLVVSGGSGYTTATPPTIVLTGGTLISGTALTTASFAITVNRGKVVSVYLATPGTAAYSVPPTLAFTGGTGGSGATLAFPAACWPTATATVGTNGQITNFTVTNAGFGYVAAPAIGIGGTSGTAAGGTFTTIATVPTCRIGLYNLSIGNFAPAATTVTAPDDATIPTNRKINSLTLAGLQNLSNDLELFGSTPFTLTSGSLNMGTKNLLFSWNGYAGVTGSAAANVTNGSITLTTRGGGPSGSTLLYPFDAPFVAFTGSAATVDLGSTITQLTVSRTAAPSGTGGPIGTRAYNAVVNAGALYGTNPTVTLAYNVIDVLTTDQPSLFVGQSAALTGAWTTRSVTNAAAALTSIGSTGTRVTATTGVGPIVPTGNDFYAWVSTFVNDPLSYAITRSTGQAFSSIMASGTDLPWGTAGAVSNDDITASISLAAIPGGTPTFLYNGQTITGFSMCSNGWVKLNSTVSPATTLTSFGNLLNAIPNIVAPFWDDLSTNPNSGSSAGDLVRLQNSMKYKVIGATAGSRQIVLEWNNMTVFGAAGPQLTFQVVLDETNNSIKMNYGLFQAFNGTNNNRYTYSVGLSSKLINTFALPGQVLAQQYENTTAFSNNGTVGAAMGANGLLISPECNSTLTFVPGTYGGFTPPANLPPANDEAANAIAVPALTAFPSNLCGNFYTSRNATPSPLAICAGIADDDVWFKFTANQTATTVRIYGSGGYQARTQVLDASLNPLAASQCVVAAAAGNSVDALLTGLNLGDVYYVRVYHDGGGVQANITCGINANGQIATFNFTNGGSGYTTTTTPSTGNVPRAIFTGGGGTDGAATLTLTGGVVTGVSFISGYGYTSAPTIQIDKPGSAHSGEFAIVVYAPAINDNCAAAKNLTNLTNSACTLGQNSLNDNTGSATPSPEPTSSCGTPDDDVWFKFTAIQNFTNINVQGTGSFDVAFELFDGGVSGGSCATKTSLSCTNATGAGSAEFLSATTVIGNTYFVRAYHAGTGTVTGETFNICVNSAPPACPTIVAPASALSINAATGTTLSWTAAGAPSSITTGYDVYLDTNNPPTTLVSANQVGTTFVTGALTANAVYYWSIAPKNSVGTTAACTVSNFNTNPPACPTLPNPANATTTCLSTSATLVSWAATAGATGYDVFFDAGAGPATTSVSTNQAGLTYNAGVLAAGQYTWKVNAKNGNGTSVGCTDWTFTVNPKPTVSTTPTGTIALCAPATQLITGITNAATPTFQWLNNNVPIAAATTISYTAASSGSYRLKVTDGVTGCTDTSLAVIINVSALPIVSINTVNSTISCDSAKLSVVVSGLGGNSPIKITEVTLYAIGTGQTATYPAYITGADYVEISNISSSPVNVGGYTLADYGSGSSTANHPYTILPGTIIPANGVMVINLGTGTDDIPNLYFNTAGASDSYFSGGLVGIVLKNGSTVIDAVGLNSGYTFDLATGVTAADWSGFAPSLGGFAGAIRTSTTDNNSGSDWSQSNTPSPLQTIGTYNTVGYVLPLYTAAWTPVTGLFTDAALTTPYLSGQLATVYAKPSMTTTFTATVINGACTVTSTSTITVLPAGTCIWTGAINTDWNNVGNWNCAGIPTITSVVVIPAGRPNYPVVNLNVEIKTLTVATGASVTTGTGFELKLNGL